MPLAVVTLEFDPFIRLGDWTLPLETLGYAAAVLGALLVAALIVPSTGSARATRRGRLRRDDLLLVVLAVMPGAVVAGRLGYGLLHLDFYRVNPMALLDPGQGSASLPLAVVGGALTGGYAAWLLTGVVRPWLHVAALPTLVAIGAGKAAMALGGSGQGIPSDAPWAIAYAGGGPWGSAMPAIPAHPAQLYEAMWTLAVLVVVGGLAVSGALGRTGSAFFTAVAVWLIGRVAIAVTWPDPAILGPLRGDQLLSLAITAACVVAGVLVSIERRHADGRVDPTWPDPETRARF